MIDQNRYRISSFSETLQLSPLRRLVRLIAFFHESIDLLSLNDSTAKRGIHGKDSILVVLIEIGMVGFSGRDCYSHDICSSIESYEVV